jgi:DnaJ-domain-containing protein 1
MTQPTITRTWTVTAAYAQIAFRLMHLTFADVEIEDIRESGRRSSDRAPRAGDPYVVLHLRETAPPELVTAAHRCLAKLNHPDRGGDHDAMQAINAAAEALKGGTA